MTSQHNTPVIKPTLRILPLPTTIQPHVGGPPHKPNGFTVTNLNLNEALDTAIKWGDYSHKVASYYELPNVVDARVSVHIGNLSSKLIDCIHQSDGVVGCVAWLTHFGVLQKMAEKQFVSIVVQKEDFLRPDTTAAMASRSDFKRNLHEHYSRLPNMESDGGQIMSKRHGDHRARGIDIKGVDIFKPPLGGWEDWGAVRCVGYAKRENQIVPLMHHKFLVFLRRVKMTGLSPYTGEVEEYTEFIPYAVWTGSFNISANAEKSRENAIFIEDMGISKFYLDEWQRLVSASESLNWTHDYVQGEIRIGGT